MTPKAGGGEHHGEQTSGQFLKEGGKRYLGIRRERESKPRFRDGFGVLEETLILLLLALDAMPCPRHRLQTLRLDFPLT